MPSRVPPTHQFRRGPDAEVVRVSAPRARTWRRPAAVLTAVVAILAGACGRSEPADTARAGRSRAVPRWTEAWRFTPPTWAGMPASDGRDTVVPYGNNVVLLDAKGGVRWDVEHPGLRLVTPLLLPDAVVLAGEESVVALDRKDGRARWSVPLDDYATPPAAWGDLVLTNTWSERTLALDARTGALRWQAPTGKYPFGTPAVAGDVVVVSWEGGWSARHAADGRELWTRQLPPGDTSPPVTVKLDDGRWLVAVVGGDAHAHAVDVRTGEPVWSTFVGAPGSPEVPPVVATNGRDLVMPNQYAGINVVAAATGEYLWGVETPGAAVMGGPAVLSFDDLVVMPVDEGYAYVSGPEGEDDRFDPEGRVAGVAALPRGFVLATTGGENTEVVAYRFAR